MPIIRRAGVGDAALLVSLIREFCRVDRHPYDEQRLTRALGPDSAASHAQGYAALAWS